MLNVYESPALLSMMLLHFPMKMKYGLRGTCRRQVDRDSDFFLICLFKLCHLGKAGLIFLEDMDLEDSELDFAKTNRTNQNQEPFAEDRSKVRKATGRAVSKWMLRCGRTRFLLSSSSP